MDFVNFDLAKTLNEKGFEQGFNIFGYKLIFSDENTAKHISNIGAYEKDYFGINIPCPTISQVLCWLRKEKKIHIVIDFDSDMNWYYQIAPYGQTTYEKESEHKYKSYEQAALAGIEYVLNNLI